MPPSAPHKRTVNRRLNIPTKSHAAQAHGKPQVEYTYEIPRRPYAARTRDELQAEHPNKMPPRPYAARTRNELRAEHPDKMPRKHTPPRIFIFKSVFHAEPPGISSSPNPCQKKRATPHQSRPSRVMIPAPLSLPPCAIIPAPATPLHGLLFPRHFAPRIPRLAQSTAPAFHAAPLFAHRPHLAPMPAPPCTARSCRPILPPLNTLPLK